MARPRLSDQKKKVAVSISVSREMAELAEATGNSSHFFQTSAECGRALALLVQKLRVKALSLKEAMEDVEDIADIWMREFDGTIPFEALEERKRAAEK